MSSCCPELLTLSELHRVLAKPLAGGDVVRVTGVKGDEARYWHYGCDGDDDRGWGCGYRTLQTVCSWVKGVKGDEVAAVPSLGEVQQTLVRIGDKEPPFVGSRNWIGSVEVSLVVDTLFDVPCRIVYVRSGADLASDEGKEAPFRRLEEHFHTFGGPVMMGGDADASSKGVFGTLRLEGQRTGVEDKFLLIVDPHFWKGKGKTARSLEEVISAGYIAWKKVPQDFMESSFYNLCFPLLERAQ